MGKDEPVFNILKHVLNEVKEKNYDIYFFPASISPKPKWIKSRESKKKSIRGDTELFRESADIRKDSGLCP